MCGEKLNLTLFRLVSPGSPPRVRGKVFSNAFGQTAFGITPACAGKSYDHSYSQGLERDHPRVCGEKALAPYCDIRYMGSPPRVRGKGAYPAKVKPPFRITPACAGKRMDSLAKYCDIKDHPRVCGEKIKYIINLSTAAGSPPRVRGKGRMAAHGRLPDRITPACAGKRIRCKPAHCPKWDHPRVCGEKYCLHLVALRIAGSPPRVRGKD